VGEQRHRWNAWEFTDHHLDPGARGLIAARDGDEHRCGAIGFEILHDVFDRLAMKRLVGPLARRVDAQALDGREHGRDSGQQCSGRG